MYKIFFDLRGLKNKEKRFKLHRINLKIDNFQNDYNQINDLIKLWIKSNMAQIDVYNVVVKHTSEKKQIINGVELISTNEVKNYRIESEFFDDL